MAYRRNDDYRTERGLTTIRNATHRFVRPAGTPRPRDTEGRAGKDDAEEREPAIRCAGCVFREWQGDGHGGTSARARPEKQPWLLLRRQAHRLTRPSE